MTKSATLTALHSSASPEHGTPPEIVEAARTVLGGIDLDPASSAVFNEIVRADKLFTKEDDGLAQEWSGRVFLNPPSGDGGKLVKRFWEKLNDEYYLGSVTSAIWIGFSIDQLQTLQNCSWYGPLVHAICVPRKRLQFTRSFETPSQQGLFGDSSDPTPVLGESPTKPNFICYLPRRDNGFVLSSTEDRFAEAFEKFGEVRV